jgi:multisubunit Na+/H+ antiporter MnhB subunit
VGDRHHLRHRRGLAGQVPPARSALILLGGAGLVTCITFLWFSAPDLAVTQLLVEVVTTVLILLGLRWLPKRSEGNRRQR